MKRFLLFVFYLFLMSLTNQLLADFEGSSAGEKCGTPCCGEDGGEANCKKVDYQCQIKCTMFCYPENMPVMICDSEAYIVKQIDDECIFSYGTDMMDAMECYNAYYQSKNPCEFWGADVYICQENDPNFMCGGCTLHDVGCNCDWSVTTCVLIWTSDPGDPY